MQKPDVITLEDNDVCVNLLTLGCITQSWHLPWKGAHRNVLLGYQNPDHYVRDATFCGAIAGRVANRIANGSFSYAGQTYQLAQNEGSNTLHGGPEGLNRRIWQAEKDGNKRVRFSYHSPHGEQGFPGNVDFSVTITLANNCLTYGFTALPDRPTPISLAQHNYYNLAGQGDIFTHEAKLRTSQFTLTDNDLLPTGEIQSVINTPLDFRSFRSFGDADPQKNGADDNLIIDAGTGPIATVKAPNSPTLRMWSDQPGLQLYTGKHLASENNSNFKPFAGFALEAQMFPDAVNIATFPSPIVTPDAPYHQTTRIEIA